MQNFQSKPVSQGEYKSKPFAIVDESIKELLFSQGPNFGQMMLVPDDLQAPFPDEKTPPNNFANSEIRTQILEFVRSANRYRQEDILDCLPTGGAVSKGMTRLHRVAQEDTEQQLTILTAGHRLLALGGQRRPVCYLHNDPGTFEFIRHKILERMQEGYYSVFRTRMPLDRIPEVFEDQFSRGNTSFHEFSALFEIHNSLQTFEILFKENSPMFSPENQAREEKKAALALEKQKTRHEPPPGSPPEARLRSVNSQEWKEYTRRVAGISWATVLEKFGPNMMINIMLRRQDYGALERLVRESDLFGREDYTRILENLRKIETHGDIAPPRSLDFRRLKEFLERR